MKPLVIALSVLFLVLQYKLWFEKSSLSEASHLKQAITIQAKENDFFIQQNTVLAAEIQELKSGQAAIEERARNDLGLIKPNEVFYQIVEK